MTTAPRPRLVVLTHMAPIHNADNAGQNFVTAQVEHWMQSHEVRCLLIPGRSSRTQLAQSIVETHVIPQAPTSFWKRITEKVGRRVLRSLPGVPNPDLAYDFWNDEVSRQWLLEADAIVLQWGRESALAGFLRKRCSRAQIVGVLHDVDSQAIQRRLERAVGVRERTKLRVQHLAASLAERKIMTDTHAVMVLSNKDAQLLPRGRARVCVVPPPINAPADPQRSPEAGRILFVAGGRPENEDALDWLLNEVLPHTTGRATPEEIHVVGRQTPEATARFSARGVNMLGFVDDLAAEYRRAAVVVVPLQLGAGVKFKTVEAIFHRVPLVTTAIGAEGIVGLEGTSSVTDDPKSFGQRLARILENPKQAQDFADDLHAEVTKHLGPSAFQQSMDKVLIRNPQRPKGDDWGRRN